MIHWRDQSQATAPLGYIWWFTEGIIPRPLHHWATFGDSLKGSVPGHCTTGLHLVIHWRDQSQATKPLGYIWWFTEGIIPRPVHHWATFGDSLKGSVPGQCTTGLHLSPVSVFFPSSNNYPFSQCSTVGVCLSCLWSGAYRGSLAANQKE